MSKGKNTFEELDRLKQEMEKLQERYQKIRTSCRHRKSNGLPKLEMLGKKDRNKYDKGDVRCKRCNTEFNARLIREDDLMVAVRTLHNAIHQIILYSQEGKDNEQISMLGQMDYNLLKVGERYVDIVLRKGKKNKKKNKKNKSNYGGAKYVSSGLF